MYHVPVRAASASSCPQQARQRSVQCTPGGGAARCAARGHSSRPQLVSRSRPHPAWERRPLQAACPLVGPPSRRAAPPGVHWSPQPCPGPPRLTLRPLQGLGEILWSCESPPSRGPAAEPRSEEQHTLDSHRIGPIRTPRPGRISHGQASQCHSHRTCQQYACKTVLTTAPLGRQPQQG